jgi:hypothetical protein
MDEGRKRCADSCRDPCSADICSIMTVEARVPATISAISDGIRWAEQLMAEIHCRWSVSK